MNFMRLIYLVFIITHCVFNIRAQNFSQSGKASYYADKFEGRTTANGEKYRHSKLTAAHRTLQFGTKVKVTNTANQKSVIVTINDRGPFVEGRIIDLSKSAAQKLDFIHAGLADVTLEIVDAAASNTQRGQMTMAPQVDIATEDKTYYRVSAEKLKPQGYGVQIGSFEEMANLIKLADDLNSAYRSKVTVKVVQIGGKKLYQVIVGQENIRKKAEKLRTKLSVEYPNSFIVKF
jgi:rare lipoprotein A